MKLVHIALLGVFCLAGCVSSETRPEAAHDERDDPHIAKLFQLLNNYCHPGYADLKQLTDVLSRDPGLEKVQEASSLEFHVGLDEVNYAIIPERDGCTLDMLTSGAGAGIDYRRFYKALREAGYKVYGGISRRGVDVDRHYVSAEGVNALVFIPGPDASLPDYLSLHVELFDRHSPSLFPRSGVYVRREMSKALADHFRTQAAVTEGGKNDSAAQAKEVARSTLAVLRSSFEDGRLGLGAELGTLAFIAGNLPALADDPAMVGGFIEVASRYAASYNQYKSIGYISEMDDADDHGFSGYASVAAGLLSIGEFEEAARFYRAAWEADGKRLQSADPAGYIRFAGDYSAALYGSGETGDAEEWWQSAADFSRRAKGSPVQYLGRRALKLSENDSFDIKEGDEEQEYAAGDGVRVSVQQVKKAFDGARYVKYFNVKFSAGHGKYTIVGLRHRSQRSVQWVIVHPLQAGIDPMSFSEGRPTELEEWPIGAAVPVTLFAGGAVQDSRIFDTMQVEFLLRSENNRLRTITLNIPFAI